MLGAQGCGCVERREHGVGVGACAEAHKVGGVSERGERLHALLWGLQAGR